MITLIAPSASVPDGVPRIVCAGLDTHDACSRPPFLYRHTRAQRAMRTRKQQHSSRGRTPLLLLLILLMLALCGLQVIVTMVMASWLPSPAIIDHGAQQLSVQQQHVGDVPVSLNEVLTRLLEVDLMAMATVAASGGPPAEDRKDLAFTGNHVCASHKAVVWEEWRPCIERGLATRGDQSSFEEFIVAEGPRMPWSLHSNDSASAVLLEFRPWAKAMRFAVNNVIRNLPVEWRIQIVGGPAVCGLAQRTFPSEIAAGKVVVTDLGIGDYMRQDLISRVMTDLHLLYDRLLGDTWLFFQVRGCVHRLGSLLSPPLIQPFYIPNKQHSTTRPSARSSGTSSRAFWTQATAGGARRGRELGCWW